ncbi:energy-coupling factor ABC transporter ATP-binding protein [Propioniciclava soli]|uniref:energy-coupling factor ABC transporter ATP-binding protein n=1 Tax=Propioniciclava soli TaxID=2775081 RepID=UPI001E2DCAA0|nr:ABC transporter ATP-binding protein [Propioniciclava soli]
MIEITGLTHTYPDGREALAGIDLSVAAGEKVAVFGPNGAGKTTLMLHLNGLLLPTSGTVTVAGTALRRRTGAAHLAAVRRRVGVLFQDPDDQLFCGTVRDDVAFGPANQGLRGDQLDARVAAALASVDATALADRAPHHLSYGQKQRVALAGVLALEPEVVVLDEPTSMLDPATRRELVAVLAGIAAKLLVVTHDLPLALQLCPRAVILDEGRVVADGSTASLLADEALLAAHRLELPWGFDRALLFPGAITPGSITPGSITQGR